jgi:hypothetical protein
MLRISREVDRACASRVPKVLLLARFFASGD